MKKCKSSELMHNTLNKWGVVLLEAKDEEEDLVVGGTKLLVIIASNKEIFTEITLILHGHVHIVKNWTTLSKNAYN